MKVDLYVIPALTSQPGRSMRCRLAALWPFGDGRRHTSILSALPRPFVDSYSSGRAETQATNRPAGKEPGVRTKAACLLAVADTSGVISRAGFHV